MFAKNPLVNTVCKVHKEIHNFVVFPFLGGFVHLKFLYVGANFLGAKSNFIAKA
jgi:hypothetical protein